MQNGNTDNQKQPDQSEVSLDEELQSPPQEKKSERLPIGEFRKDAKQRSKKQPIIQRILKAVRREDKDYKELIINAEPLEKRVALLTNGVLEKFEVERAGEDRMVGAIFKGKIQNLEPGLKAAFVDIGMDKNAFLHYWDILPAASDSSVEIVRENRTAEQKNKSGKTSLKDIPNLYPVGSEILVQVTKAQIGSKGPRTTTNIAIPGRFLVLMPFSGQCGISRKIADKEERQRLKKILQELTIPEGMGVIIRTAGEGQKARYFVRDLHILLKTWEEIQANQEASKKPTRLYMESDLIERTMRDFLTEDIDRVLVDNQEAHERMLFSVARISPRSKSKIGLFKENIPIFERFNIERQIEQTFMRKVPLPSGGEIVIEETEALVAIDVNTGGHRNADASKNFILQANLEAAREVARQVRLRNIGGLIIIDFIDMKNKKDRNAVLNRMRQEMRKDKAKNNILPISQLGIMQMSRQRHKESHSSGLYVPCPYCRGRGIVKSSRTISVEVQRRLVSVLRRLQSSQQGDAPIQLRILLHPANLERLRQEDEHLLVEIEKTYNVHLTFRADPAYHVENFKVIEASSGREYV